MRKDRMHCIDSNFSLFLSFPLLTDSVTLNLSWMIIYLLIVLWIVKQAWAFITEPQITSGASELVKVSILNYKLSFTSMLLHSL